MPLKTASNPSLRCALALLSAVTALPCLAKPIEEIFQLPVTVTNMYGRVVTQPITVTVFRDDEKTGQPFLVLNHGRPAQSADFARMGRTRFSDNSNYFVSKGFAVFVPTRIGYGVTGGEDMEYSGTCSNRNYPAAYEAAARQSVALIEHIRTLPYIDASRGLVVGQSFGGATAIALAAKNLPSVVAAVNFAGGGGGDPIGRPENPCRADLLEDLFASYGNTSRIPTLWLYSENDRYFGKEKPLSWFKAFVSKGGTGKFVQLPALAPPLGDDGHSSFTRNPAAWRPAFEQFLESAGF